MKGKKLTIFLFYLLLAAVPAAILLTPKVSFSQTENRLLAEFPRFSSSAAGHSYMAETEDYLRDRFPLREQLLGLRTQLELLSGKKEVNGVFVLSDRLIEKMDSVSEEAITEATETVSAFSRRFSGTSTLMLIPTAAAIDSSQLPSAAPNISQKAVIDRIYESLDGGVNTVDCYTPLIASQGLTLFYRSDPRWTSLGAYMGYSACASQMGFTPVSLNRLNVEHATHDYRGQLYNRTLYSGPRPDTIDLYSLSSGEPQATLHIYNNEEGWRDHEGLYFRELLSSSDPYSVFLGPEEPVITVNTSVKNGRSLLVFRDSTASALPPLLAMHYSTITLVDLSLLQSPLDELITLSDYDQALFCYSLQTITQPNKHLMRQP